MAYDERLPHNMKLNFMFGCRSFIRDCTICRPVGGLAAFTCRVYLWRPTHREEETLWKYEICYQWDSCIYL